MDCLVHRKTIEKSICPNRRQNPVTIWHTKTIHQLIPNPIQIQPKSLQTIIRSDSTVFTTISKICDQNDGTMTIDIAQHTNSIAHLHRVAVVWLRTNIDTNVFDTTANPPDKILQDKILLMLVLFWRKYANEVLPSARCRRYNLMWKVFPNSKNEKRLLNKFFNLHF